MEKTFTVNIITPDSPTITAEIQLLHTKSPDGEVEFRANHTPIIISAAPAATKLVKIDGSNEILFTSSGIIIIEDNVINFCCDSVQRPEEIDITRAISAKERAESRLTKDDKSNVDIDETRAKLALARAMSRIETTNIYKN